MVREELFAVVSVVADILREFIIFLVLVNKGD